MLNKNLKPFLDTIAYSEGTFGKGHDGYNVLYGGGYFQGYNDHPRKKLRFAIKGKFVTSTAAGRYQILARYYDAYRVTLNLRDFSPASQDAIAVQMIREQRAMADVEAGRFELAVRKCANIWASLPGAGYGQHENTMIALRDFFVGVGGKLS